MDASKPIQANILPEELERKFAQARVRIRALSATKGLALVVFTALAAFAIAIVVDRIFYLQMPFRVLVFAATLVALAVCLVANLVVPLLRRYTARRIALAVEDRHPELGDLVVSTVELTEHRAAGKLTGSTQLVDALTRETLGRSRSVDFRSVAPVSTIRWALVLALVLTAVVGAYCVMQPPVAHNVLLRILNPTADLEPFTYTTIDVSPGSCAVAKGSDVELVVTASGRVPADARLVWRAGHDRWRRLKLPVASDGTARYTFNNVLRPITYRLRVGDARSGSFSIEPVVPPAIIDFEVTCEYPAYTGLGEQPGPSRSGNIRALRGTRVRVIAAATKPVETAWVTFDYPSAETETDEDGVERPPDESGELVTVDVDGKRVGPLTIEINEQATYTFHLRDEHGFTNQKPVAYSITPLPDRAPEIDIASPESATRRTPDMGVPIRFVARDDFGLTALRLVYRATTSEPKEEKDLTPEDVVEGKLPIELPHDGLTELPAEYFLDLASLGLQPGMVLRFRLEATDNDAINGPKTGKSVERVVTIISDQDAFKRVEEEQQALQRRLRKLIRQQADNKKLTEQLEAELAAADALSLKQAEQLEEAKRAEDAIAEATRELARDFDPTIETMQENPLVQPRSVMRMQEMKDALAELARREMALAGSQLKAARDAASAEQRARQLEHAAQTEQEIVRALNRINDQFDRLQEEQRLLSLASSAKSMARLQNSNLDSTREAARDLMGRSPGDLAEDQRRRLKKLVDREKGLRQKLEEFEEEMERALRQLEYRRSKDAESVESAIEQLRQDRLSELMKQAEEELRVNHLSKSIEPQQKASESLWRMANQLEQAQRARLAGEFENTEAAMQAHISEIDRLIEIETQIIAATEQIPTSDNGGPDEAADAIAQLLDRYGGVEDSQRRAHERAEQFSGVLADIFAQLVMPGIDPVTPLRAAVNSMADATERLGQLRRSDALGDERRALEALLEARDQLSRALAKLMAESMIAQMQQQIDALAEIIEKQRTINEETKETDAERPRTEELTAAFRRLIERLANRQGRLGNEVVDLSRVLEPLGKIGERMRAVSDMLRDLRTGKDTQEEQDKILAELEQLMFGLEAQLQSMMQAMGMSSGRGAGTGNRSGLNLPSSLRELPGGPLAELELPERLRRELLQAWSEKYPESFRELLSLYYRRLSEEENPF